MSLMQGRFGLSTARHQISSWLPLFMERLNTIFLKYWSKDTSPFPCYCCFARLLGSYGALQEICDQNNEGWHFSLGKKSISFGIGPFTMGPGDVVRFLDDADTPWIIRPCSDGYRLVGEREFFDPAEDCSRCGAPRHSIWGDVIIY